MPCSLCSIGLFHMPCSLCSIGLLGMGFPLPGSSCLPLLVLLLLVVVHPLHVALIQLADLALQGLHPFILLLFQPLFFQSFLQPFAASLSTWLSVSGHCCLSCCTVLLSLEEPLVWLLCWVPSQLFLSDHWSSSHWPSHDWSSCQSCCGWWYWRQSCCGWWSSQPCHDQLLSWLQLDPYWSPQP